MPATVTYDAAGGVVSVAVPEPRFTRAEVDVLLEARRLEQEPRGAHGFPLREATDPANQYRAVVPLPTLDFYQAAMNKAKDDYRKRWPDADMSALLWRVEIDD